MSRALLIVFLLATSTLATEYPQSIQTSISIMPPNQETRIADGDTVKNPFNYEVAVGYERTIGWAKGSMWTWRERDNGANLTGLETHALFGGRYLEAGMALTDRDDRDIHAAQWHIAMKFFRGMLGVGLNRQYYSLIGDPAWLARLSLDYAIEKTVKLHAVYGRGGSGNQELTGRIDIAAITFGPDDRLTFGPTAKGTLLDGPNGRRTAYQVKLVLSLGM